MYKQCSCVQMFALGKNNVMPSSYHHTLTSPPICISENDCHKQAVIIQII